MAAVSLDDELLPLVNWLHRIEASAAVGLWRRLPSVPEMSGKQMIMRRKVEIDACTQFVSQKVKYYSYNHHLETITDENRKFVGVGSDCFIVVTSMLNRLEHLRRVTGGRVQAESSAPPDPSAVHYTWRRCQTVFRQGLTSRPTFPTAFTNLVGTRCCRDEGQKPLIYFYDTQK